MAITTPQTAPAVAQLDVPSRAIDRVDAAQNQSVSELPPNRGDLAIMQMTDARFTLPDGILSKVDRASVLNSLEVRVSFLDADVFEYAMGLPLSYKITPRK